MAPLDTRGDQEMTPGSYARPRALSAAATRLLPVTPSEVAMLRMFSNETFRSPLSTSPMYVGWRLARCPSSSCVHPHSRRTLRTSDPKAWWAVLRGLIHGGGFLATAYKSTDYKWDWPTSSISKERS